MIKVELNNDDLEFITETMRKFLPEHKPKHFHLIIFDHVIMKKPLPTTFSPPVLFGDYSPIIVLATGKEEIPDIATKTIFPFNKFDNMSSVINIGDSVEGMDTNKLAALCKIANKLAKSNKIGECVKSVLVVTNDTFIDYTDTVSELSLGE